MSWPLTVWWTSTTRDVTSAPGISTGAACEMISVRPASASSIPSVVMNDETPNTSVITPLSSPTAEHTTSAATRHATSGNPAWLNS